jgi:hypothetical protein
LPAPLLRFVAPSAHDYEASTIRGFTSAAVFQPRRFSRPRRFAPPRSSSGFPGGSLLGFVSFRVTPVSSSDLLSPTGRFLPDLAVCVEPKLVAQCCSLKLAACRSWLRALTCCSLLLTAGRSSLLARVRCSPKQTARTAPAVASGILCGLTRSEELVCRAVPVGLQGFTRRVDRICSRVVSRSRGTDPLMDCFLWDLASRCRLRGRHNPKVVLPSESPPPSGGPRVAPGCCETVRSRHDSRL